MVNKNGSPQAPDCLRLLKEKANKTGFDFVCLWWSGQGSPTASIFICERAV